jgi:HlyD family secretion protein
MAKSNHKTRRKIVIFSVIGVAVVGLSVAAILRKREVMIPVQTEKAVRRNITEVVVANGKIQPFLQVKISPEVSGEIIELPVKEGQDVKKGDLLVKVNPDIYLSARNSAEASYRSALAGKNLAAATLAKAETEFKRNEDLFRSKLISESVLLDFKTSYEVARAQFESTQHQVDVAKASLTKADDDLARTTIRSPITGTVSKLNSELGERVVGTAMMTGTEIMTVADLNNMEARVDVGEIDVVLMKVGQHARLEVDAFRDQKFNGTVSQIANSSKGANLPNVGGQSQEATRFEVRIRVLEREPFRPGMSVTAEVETRSRTNVLCVPIQSVTTRLPKKPDDAKKPGVQLAAADLPTKSASSNAPATTNPPPTAGTNAAAGTNSAKASDAKKGEAPKSIEVVFVAEGDHVKMVPVKLGISDDNYWEITEGLKDGQEVVSGGYKAISRELEDGKNIKKGEAVLDLDKDKDKDKNKP